MKYLLSLLFILSGCASTQHAPVGFGGTLPGLVNVTKNPMVLGTGKETKKRGESCSYSILGLINFGDASTSTAKSNGNISEITMVDGESLSILGIYAHYCTVVRGS